ncbi:unnamed protein product [Acanthoscelides obtectus]|nr:unnamed protein product [Acanthoscelides obtectus]CAK1661559.1 hypothetical protein AOBTE_LOCUS22685 [Acanthoscelides obtectus]
MFADYYAHVDLAITYPIPKAVLVTSLGQVLIRISFASLIFSSSRMLFGGPNMVCITFCSSSVMSSGRKVTLRKDSSCEEMGSK